ncbi:hypothetical protein AGMMS50293_04040 [Spirochaetia bacterium]|nr:hypothetical protein AGMMS50293_04040 [Spirochaetia bacterium]
MTPQTIIQASYAAIAFILFGVFFFALFKNKEKLKGRISAKAPRAVFFLCVFAAAAILNWIGLSSTLEEGETAPWIFKLMASFGTTIKMFGVDWEGANSPALAAEYPIYGVACALCFAAAVLFTALLVIAVFLKSLLNEVRITLLRRTAKKSYIITGRGTRQETLVKSLTDEQKRRTIIISPCDEDEKKRYLTEGYLLIDAEADEETLIKAGLFDTRETVLISIADDDESNLATARTITRYFASRSESLRKKMNFTAHIMYTNIDRTEHFEFSEAAEGRINFFNPYEIIARSFLFNNPVTRLIPPGFIETQKARLKKRANILHVFIGFGQANVQLLKRSISINQLLGADFNAVVIDEDIKENEAAFRNYSRGLFTKEGETPGGGFFPSPEEKYRIEFLEMNALSTEMYETLIERIKAADAASVVICLGEDQLSAETAMELRQNCYEADIPGAQVSIFVRAYKHSAIVGDDVINAGFKKGNEGGLIKIETFGFEDKIFSLDAICDKDMDTLAKHIAENYSGGGEYSVSWKNLINHERDSNRYAALSIRTKLNLLGFDLIFDETGKTTQDETVLQDFAAAYGMDRAQRLRADKAYLDYIERNPDGSIADTPRNNIARLEHQRWNSYYLVNGWLPLPKAKVSAAARKNQRTQKHACITTFEGLDELAAMQAGLRSAEAPEVWIAAPEAERSERYREALRDCDTKHLDCDQMDCLVGNLKDTKYRIVRKDAG